MPAANEAAIHVNNISIFPIPNHLSSIDPSLNRNNNAYPVTTGGKTKGKLKNVSNNDFPKNSFLERIQPANNANGRQTRTPTPATCKDKMKIWISSLYNNVIPSFSNKTYGTIVN